MDLLRRDVEGGEVTHAVRVVLAPAGKVGGGGRGTGPGHILAHHEVEEGAVPRDGTVHHGGAAVGHEPRPIGLRHAGGKAAEGRVEHALVGIVDDVGADGHVVAVEHHPREREAGPEALAHVRDLLRDVGGERPEAADVVPVIEGIGERRGAGQLREPGMKTGVGVDRKLPVAELVVRDVVLQLAGEHVVADAVRNVEAGAVDCLETLQRRPAAVRRALEVGRRRRGEPVVVSVVADSRSEQRLLPQPRFPFLVEEPMEIGRHRERRREQDHIDHRCLPQRLRSEPGSWPRTTRWPAARPAAACTTGTSTTRS